MTSSIARNIMRAKGFPRFAETGTLRSLHIDTAFQYLTAYRSARLNGGADFYANRNVLHVSMPAIRAQIAAASL